MLNRKPNFKNFSDLTFFLNNTTLDSKNDYLDLRDSRFESHMFVIRGFLSIIVIRQLQK